MPINAEPASTNKNNWDGSRPAPNPAATLLLSTPCDVTGGPEGVHCPRVTGPSGHTRRARATVGRGYAPAQHFDRIRHNAPAGCRPSAPSLHRESSVRGRYRDRDRIAPFDIDSDTDSDPDPDKRVEAPGRLPARETGRIAAAGAPHIPLPSAPVRAYIDGRSE